jgi:hypothetical protein
MYALIENNQIVKTSGNARVFFPNVSFPASGPTAQFLTDNGVKTVVDGERKDERFYWVTPAQPAIQLVNGVPTRLYVNTPKALEDVTEVPEGQEEEVTTAGLKTQWLAQVKENANKELAPTDWYVIRKAERGVAIPQEIIDARAAIISACAAKEAAITAVTTLDELKEVLFPVVIFDDFLSGNGE